MKPMLKAAFFSLVNDLLARGVTPVLNASTLTSYGSIKWTEGDSTRVEELYAVRDCSPLTASIFRKRFKAWFAEIMNKHSEQLVADAGIVVGSLVWDKLFYKQRTVTAIRAGGALELDAEVERCLDQVVLLSGEALEVNQADKGAFQAYWDMAGGQYEHARADFHKLHAEALEQDATFEENLLFLASRDMADIWHKHTTTMQQRILLAAYGEALRVAQAINDMIDIEVPAHTAMVIAFENLHEHDKAHAEALAMYAALGQLKEPNRINDR